jgi:hypothetical protein
MIDVSAWDAMLKTYVDEQGRVNYAHWQQTSANDLDHWLTSVRDVEVQSLSQSGAIAFLINLYNALTIQQVLQRYPIQSIRPEILGIPNWLGFLRFFTKTVYVLNGRSLSLNTIEHDILRKIFTEPRIHFALVCASVGCPLLRSEAYVPEKLDEQLNDDAHRFIQNPEKISYHPQQHTLYCSKIFKWYSDDFQAQAGSVVDYIRQYLPAISQSELIKPIKIAYLPYSWALNQRISS